MRSSHGHLIFIMGIPIPGKMVFILIWDPWPRFNIKMLSYQYRKFHCGDKMVVRSSYLHNGISYVLSFFVTPRHWTKLSSQDKNKYFRNEAYNTLMEWRMTETRDRTTQTADHAISVGWLCVQEMWWSTRDCGETINRQTWSEDWCIDRLSR